MVCYAWRCVLACSTPAHHDTQVGRAPHGGIGLRLRTVPPPPDGFGDVMKLRVVQTRGGAIPNIKAGEITVLALW
jgi:hypothetical protein